MPKPAIVRLIVPLVVSALCALAGLFAANGSKGSDAPDAQQRLCKVARQHYAALGNMLSELEDSLAHAGEGKDTLALFDNVDPDRLYSIYLFENEALKAWHNPCLAQPEMPNSISAGPMMRTDNGWYMVRKAEFGNVRLYALFKVWRLYPFANEYLDDGFDPSFGLPSDAVLTLARSSRGVEITDADGGYLFTVVATAGGYGVSSVMSGVAILSYAFALLLALLGLWNSAKYLCRAQGSLCALMVAALLCVAIYYVAVLLPVPVHLARSDFFSFQVFAYDWWLPSLAFVALAVALALFWAFIYYRLQSVDFESDGNAAQSVGLSSVRLWLNVSLSVLFFIGANEVLELLVHHSSQLVLFVGNFDVSFVMVAKLVIVSLAFLAFALVHERVAALSVSLAIRKYIVVAFVALGALALVSYAFFGRVWSEVALFYALYCLMMRRMKLTSRSSMVFSHMVWIVVALSLFAVLRFTSLSKRKECENRQLIAYNLSYQLVRDDDPIAEQLLPHIGEAILADSLLCAMVNDEGDLFDPIYQRLRNEFFNGYFSRYDLQVMPCQGTASTVSITGTGEVFDCLSYFRDLIMSLCAPLPRAKNFYRLNDGNARPGYFGSFKLGGSHLFLQIEAKPLAKSVGYPEVLTNKHDRLDADNLRGYSYAKYLDGQLALGYGEYDYPASLELANDTVVRWDVSNGFSHLLFPSGNNQSVVISMPELTWQNAVAAYSFFFLVMLCAFAAALLALLPFGFVVVRRAGVAERIHAVFVGFVVLLFILVCVVSGWLTGATFENENRQRLSEGLASVCMSLADEVGGVPLGQGIADADNLLLRLSESLFADIHLFDADGGLVGTSKRELFRSGLVAPLMNDEALRMLRGHERREVFVREQVGNFSYFSIYAPLFERNGELMGYVNVPFFSDVSALRKTMLASLLPLANSFMLIVLFSVLFSYFLARGITMPLIQVRDRLRELDINKQNVPIDYSSDDEIGEIVRAYNRMTQQLSASVEKLAASERESTWREMARQIAHEIKNPLTPMKLKMQYLVRLWDDHPERFEPMLRSTSQTLIEQIDQLADVASRFSDIAKMRRAEPVRMDIAAKVASTVDLFARSENATVSYSGPAEGVFINADPAQMTSVFNNLIKNALQSVANQRHVDISVSLALRDDTVNITVSDNGDGIPEDIRDKVFMPKFTTKSQGMGLGLAITKTIVVNSGGSISFETHTGQGTSFLVVLPIIE